MNEEASKSKRILGRDEPGIFDHDLVTSGSFKAHGGGLNKLAGPLTMQKWLGFAIVSADPSSVDAWGLREAGRAWFNTTDKLFKFWDGTQILLLAPMQSVTSMRLFLDNFTDASQHWAWRLFKGTTPANKAGVEQTGQFWLSIDAGTSGRWDTSVNEGVRLFLSPAAFPCEVTTRLDEYSANASTYAELFISKAPVSFGADNYFAIGRYQNGIWVNKNGSSLATVAVVTLPLWLRMRIGSAAYASLNVYFDYSLDGADWTNLYTQNSGWQYFQGWGGGVGLCVRNVTPYNAVLGKFDFFATSLARGPG